MSTVSHSKESDQTGVLGLRWFLGGGFLAVIFSLFLVWSDDYLSNSKQEEIKNKALLELRDAQTSLPSGVIDARQLSNIKLSNIKVDKHAAQEESQQPISSGH